MPKKKTTRKASKKPATKKSAKKKAKSTSAKKPTARSVKKAISVKKKASKKAAKKSLAAQKKKTGKKENLKLQTPKFDLFSSTPQSLFTALLAYCKESPGFHIANYFIRNQGSKQSPFRLRGLAEDSEAILSDAFLSLELPADFSSFLSGLSDKPRIAKQAPPLLFGLDAQGRALPIERKEEWKDAKQASLLALPIPDMAGESVGLLLLSLIDSHPAYTQEDLKSVLPLVPFFSADAAFATLHLSQSKWKEESRRRLKREKERHNSELEKIQKELEEKEKALSQIKKETQEGLRGIEHKLKETQEKYNKQEAFHQKEKSALLDSFEKERNHLQEAFQKEQAALQKELQEKLKEAKQNQIAASQEAQTLREQKSNLEARLAQAQETRDFLESKAKELTEERQRLLTEKSLWEDKQKKIVDTHQEELQKIQEELQKQKELFEKEKTALRESFEKERQDLKEELQKKQAALQKGLQEELEKSKQNERAANQNAQALREQIQRLRGQLTEFEQKSASQQREYESTLGQIQKEKEEAVKDLEKSQALLAEAQKEARELRDKQAQIQKEKESLQAQTSDLQRRLSAKEAENQKNAESYEKKIIESHEKYERKVQELKEIADRKHAEFEAQIAALEKAHKEKIDRLKAEFTEDQEAVLKENKILSEEKHKLEREFVQSQTNYQNSLYELRQKLKIEAERAERKLKAEREKFVSLEASHRELQEKIASERRAWQSEKENLEKNIEKRQQEVVDAEARLKESQSKLHFMEESLRSLKQEHVALQKKEEELNKKLLEQKSGYETEKQELQKKQKRELQALQNAIQHLEEKIEAKDRHIQQIEESKNSLETQKASLEKDLHDAQMEAQGLSARALELERQLEENIAHIEESRKTLEKQDGLLREREKSIQSLEAEKKALGQSLGIEQERTTALERELQDLKQRLHRSEQEIKNRQEEKQALIERIRKLEQEILQKNKESSEARDEIERLKQELQKIEERKEGLLFEQKVLEDALSAITRQEGLEEKVLLLQERLGVSGRVALWRIPKEGRLELAFLLPKSKLLSDLGAPKYWNIQDTLFGRILATGSPALLPLSKKTQDADVPSAWLSADTPPIESSLCIPLLLQSRTKGVLLFSSNKAAAFGEREITLAKKLAPLIALALDLEERQESQKKALGQQDLQKKAFQYIEKRFIERNTYFNYMIHQVQKGPDFLQNAPAELMAELSSPKTMPDLRTRDLEDPTQGLLTWLDLLQSQAHAHGLQTTQGISKEDIERLVERLGNNSDYLYWHFEEAVRNVLEHARAKRLLFQSRQTDSHLSLHVVDDGEGIVRTSGRERPMHKTGLPALQAMAQLMDAELRFGRGEKGYGLDLGLYWKI